MAIEIAIVTGVVGAISGVAGSIMGFVAYKHSSSLSDLTKQYGSEIIKTTLTMSGIR